MTEERMMILEMVDEKRITPDEALILLNALGEASESEPICIECFADYAGDDPDFPVSVPLIERDRVI
jgi:hypothetical protein